jgi:hypothetical protein
VSSPSFLHSLLSYLTVPDAPKAQVPDMYNTMMQSRQAAQQGYDPYAQQIVMGGRQLTNPNSDYYRPRWDTESAASDPMTLPMGYDASNYRTGSQTPTRIPRADAETKAQKAKNIRKAKLSAPES